MGTYRVAALAVVVKIDGGERYLYEGALVDGDKVDEKSLAHLLDIGFVEKVEDESAEVGDESAEKPVDKMNVAELNAYAAANSIDLGTATKKAEILGAIAAATTA